MAVVPEPAERTGNGDGDGADELRELSFGELSAICSNLAKGCEKQYLAEEMELFLKLAGYFKSKAAPADTENTGDLLAMVSKDLETEYPHAEAAAGESVLETNREHFWSIRKSSSATSADLSTLATRLRRYVPCARYQA